MSAKKQPTLYTEPSTSSTAQKDFYDRVEKKVEEQQAAEHTVKTTKKLQPISFWQKPFPTVSCIEDLSEKKNVFKLCALVGVFTLTSAMLFWGFQSLFETTQDDPVLIRPPAISYKTKPEEIKLEKTDNPIYTRIEPPKVKIAEKLCENEDTMVPNTKPVPMSSFYISLGTFKSNIDAVGYWQKICSKHYKVLKSHDPIIRVTDAHGRRKYELLVGPLQKSDNIAQKCIALGNGAKVLEISGE